MAYEFINNNTYSSGITGTDVINILQEKYGILNNFDNYVSKQIRNGFINNFKTEFEDGTVEYEIDEFLTHCFQDYILTQSSGVKFKGDKFPLIKTGNLVLNTIVRMVD